MIAGELAIYNSLIVLNECLQSSSLLAPALQVFVSLTLRLVLCYDGYRLPRSLERSRRLLMGSAAEIDAVHLRREPRQQQPWAAWHQTGRQKWGSAVTIWWILRSGRCPDAEAKYKIKKAERKLPTTGREDTYQYHSPHSLCLSMQILWPLFLGVSCSTESTFLVISSSSNIT